MSLSEELVGQIDREITRLQAARLALTDRTKAVVSEATRQKQALAMKRRWRQSKIADSGVKRKPGRPKKTPD